MTTEVVGVSADGRRWAVRRVGYAFEEACAGFCGYPKIPSPAATSVTDRALADRAPAMVTLHLCEADVGSCGAEEGWTVYALAFDELAEEWGSTWSEPDKTRCTAHEAAVVQLEAAKAAYAAAGVDLGAKPTALVRKGSAWVVPQTTMAPLGLDAPVLLEVEVRETESAMDWFVDLKARVEGGPAAVVWSRPADIYEMHQGGTEFFAHPVLAPAGGLVVYWTYHRGSEDAGFPKALHLAEVAKALGVERPGPP
ncbi:MAG: hypothetical protein JRJ84_26070 [Deltaproteobacteria bacterium]|nr:hypothetical protein [Deltaproteobacteria bacterium]